MSKEKEKKKEKKVLSAEDFQELVLKQFKSLNENIDSKFENVELRLGNIETQLDENTQILKALEHKAEVNKAEHDKMSVNLAKISGNVESLKKDLITMERVTIRNWDHIVNLKAAK